MRKEKNLFDRMVKSVDPNGVMTREERCLAIRLHRYNGNWILRRYSIDLIERLIEGSNSNKYTLNAVQKKNAVQAVELFYKRYKSTTKQRKFGMFSWLTK